MKGKYMTPAVSVSSHMTSILPEREGTCTRGKENRESTPEESLQLTDVCIYILWREGAGQPVYCYTVSTRVSPKFLYFSTS